MLTDGLECCDVLSDSHSDGTHSLQSIHWLSFWRHPFTAEHPLLRHISPNLMKTQLIWSGMIWEWARVVLTWFRNRSEDEHKPSGSCRPSRCEGCRTERVPVLSLRASTTPADLTHKHSSVHEKPWSWITMYSIFKQVIQLLAYCFFIVDMFCATYASLFTYYKFINIRLERG